MRSSERAVVDMREKERKIGCSVENEGVIRFSRKIRTAAALCGT